MNDDDVDLDDLGERLDRAAYIRHARQENAAELARDRASLRERVLNAPFRGPDPVQQWREDADRKTAAVKAETQRRLAKEDRERALEQDVAELQQLLEDALRLVDQLLAERDEVEGKRSPRARSRPKKPGLEIVDLPSGFLTPKYGPDGLVYSQAKMTRR
jgi:hypothetical protein